jgi:hypothetical protein
MIKTNHLYFVRDGYGQVTSNKYLEQSLSIDVKPSQVYLPITYFPMIRRPKRCGADGVKNMLRLRVISMNKQWVKVIDFLKKSPVKSA